MTTQHVSLTCLLCFYAQFPSANCATLFWPSTSDVYTSLPDQGIQTLRNDLSFVAAFDLPALRYAVQKSTKLRIYPFMTPRFLRGATGLLTIRRRRRPAQGRRS